MKTYKYVLALDPSGNFTEGKGTTGWCVFHADKMEILESSSLSAVGYHEMEQYWDAHLQLINNIRKRYGHEIIVVIEDYLLYATKADNQINSRMETPKLLGLLQYHCWNKRIAYHMQTAAEVKNRWTDEILVHKGYLEKHGNGYSIPRVQKVINRHSKDSIRHAVHFATFRNKSIG